MRRIVNATLFIFACLAGASHAADFPEKSVRFIVPFPPGGGTDALARILSTKLSENWGQQVVVDNRGGAQGGLGTALAAKAAARWLHHRAGPLRRTGDQPAYV